MGSGEVKEIEQGKVFLGGLPWAATVEGLTVYFSDYGEIVDCVIMTDRKTGNPRGFGFVVFSDPSSADKALEGDHIILGRTVEVKRAIPRTHHHHNQQQNEDLNKISSNEGSRNKKIFVGELPSNLTEEQFRKYFEKFGNVTDVALIYDSVTQKSRGFGFITFDSEEAVENAMMVKDHELNNKVVEVKRAVPRDEKNYYHKNNNFNKRGSSLISNPNGFQNPYSPKFGFYPGYMPPVYNGYGGMGGYYPYAANPYGGYAIGGYGGFGSWPAWNGQGMFGARPIYPPYMYGSSYPGVAANGDWNHGSDDGSYVKMPAAESPVQANGEDMLEESSCLMGCDAANKENQGGLDGGSLSSPVAVGNSS